MRLFSIARSTGRVGGASGPIGASNAANPAGRWDRNWRCCDWRRQDQPEVIVVVDAGEINPILVANGLGRGITITRALAADAQLAMGIHADRLVPRNGFRVPGLSMTRNCRHRRIRPEQDPALRDRQDGFAFFANAAEVSDEIPKRVEHHPLAGGDHLLDHFGPRFPAANWPRSAENTARNPVRAGPCRGRSLAFPIPLVAEHVGDHLGLAAEGDSRGRHLR